MPIYSTKAEADEVQALDRGQIKRHLAEYIAKMDSKRRDEFLKCFRMRHGTEIADDITSRAREAYRSGRRPVR